MAYEWALLLVAGLAAGTISGLMGVGGGIVMTPVLHYLVGRPWGEAVAMSLVVIAVQSPLGIQQHRQRGAVDRRLAVPLVIGGAVGVGAGIVLLEHLAVPWLKLLFAALMVFGAVRLVGMGAPDGDGRPATWHIAATGLLAGTVSRLLGVGGGILTVPVLALLGVPAKTAVGTSLVPVFTNAFIASIVSIATGLDLLLALPLAVGALFGAPLGVRLAHALPEKRLRLVVAAGLTAVAVLIAVEAAVHLVGVAS